MNYHKIMSEGAPFTSSDSVRILPETTYINRKEEQRKEIASGKHLSKEDVTRHFTQGLKVQNIVTVEELRDSFDRQKFFTAIQEGDTSHLNDEIVLPETLPLRTIQRLQEEYMIENGDFSDAVAELQRKTEMVEDLQSGKPEKVLKYLDNMIGYYQAEVEGTENFIKGRPVGKMEGDDKYVAASQIMNSLYDQLEKLNGSPEDSSKKAQRIELLMKFNQTNTDIQSTQRGRELNNLEDFKDELAELQGYKAVLTSTNGSPAASPVSGNT